MFGLKREEGARGWTKLHNEGFSNLYSLSNINVMEDKWGNM
jgi:hypothetical protein